MFYKCKEFLVPCSPYTENNYTKTFLLRFITYSLIPQTENKTQQHDKNRIQMISSIIRQVEQSKEVQCDVYKQRLLGVGAQCITLLRNIVYDKNFYLHISETDVCISEGSYIYISGILATLYISVLVKNIS